MKSEKFSHALGEIDVSYIEEAIHYKAVHRRKQKIWKIAVACVAVAMVAILIMPLWDTNKKESESNQTKERFMKRIEVYLIKALKTLCTHCTDVLID